MPPSRSPSPTGGGERDGRYRVEILFVEDSDEDAELTFRALRKRNLANQVHHVQDGAAALDFLFGRGEYASPIQQRPKLVLLDLKLPKVDGLEVNEALVE